MKIYQHLMASLFAMIFQGLAFALFYAILGVPEFSGLVWSAGHVDFRTREVALNKIVWEAVNITFTLTGKVISHVDD